MTVAYMSTVDQVSKLLDAVGSLISAIAWPTLVLFLVWWFRDPIAGLATDLRAAVREGRATVKAGPGGIEFSTAQAAALIQSAEARRGDGEGSRAAAPEGASSIATAVEQIADAVQSERRRAPRILWVDDSPENNRLEERALKQLGVDIRVCLSTEEALLQLSREEFDLVITDLGRPGDHRAGYTLIDEMRKRGYDIPVVIYTARATAADKEEAVNRGAFERTASPGELIELVARAVRAEGAPNRPRRSRGPER